LIQDVDRAMDEIIDWLLDDADPALEYLVRRDLLFSPATETEKLRRRIPSSDWAKALLDERKADGHWGNGVYNPKWTCTHYVLYELTQLAVPDDQDACRESAMMLLSYPVGSDGGINYARTVEYSDVCVNGMILTIASHFGIGSEAVGGIIDYLMKVRMPDGGWNCEYPHGARHSSLHTTISVIEGLGACLRGGNEHRKSEVELAIAGGIEFMLRHRLYKSERTGEVIKDEFLKFCFPVRWKYDILRCLDLFRTLGVPYDGRMEEALAIVRKAAGKNGKWKAASQAGKTYFIVEKNGTDGKWNTLRALRVLNHFGLSASSLT